MRDEETGSWWQQVTGEAIHGPLKGRKLAPVHHDEVSFAIWKRERPLGRVLKPVPGHEDDYEDWNWEKQMKKVRTVRPKGKDDPMDPRTMVVGVVAGDAARAYPFPLLRRQSPVVDRLGGVPLLLVVGEDKKSIRVFESRVDGRDLTFARRVGPGPVILFDGETGSEWDFTGTAVSGPLEGRKLEKVRALKEYWFDWKTYNPKTGIYLAGAEPGDTTVPAPDAEASPAPAPSPSPSAAESPTAAPLG